MIMLPGPVSKAMTFSWPRAGGDDGEIADAADVLKNAGADGVGEEDVIEQGDEGRALAAGGDVSRAEVGDDGDAGGGGEEGGFAELPGAGEAAACVECGHALVVEGLAVAADEGRSNFGGVDGGAEGFSVGEAEAPVQMGEFGGGCGVCIGLSGHSSEDGVAEGLGEGKGSVGEEGEFGRRIAGSDFARYPQQGDVDAVGGGAAHDAGDDKGPGCGHSGGQFTGRAEGAEKVITVISKMVACRGKLCDSWLTL